MNIDFNELCKHLEGVAFYPNNKKVTVEYFNGKKPSGYHAPQLVTTKMAMSGDADKIILAWYAEIFVNGRCIFRESYIPNDEDWEMAEVKANTKLMESIFCHGVMLAKQQIEEFNKRYIGGRVL